MSQKTPQDAPQTPPMPPEGKPFTVGDTTATVTTRKANDRDVVTLRLRRILKAPPAKVYKALTDPDALAAWLPPKGMMARTHALDAREGGRFRMSFYTATKSWSETFGGQYLEMVPDRRLVYTTAFETKDPLMQGEMRVTIQLTAVPEGTLVEVEQDGIPAPVAGGAPYGWSESFEKLAQLVEPELPF